MPEITFQPGPQGAFLSSPADIVIYGGAAGGGKTYALLLENMRCTDNPGFGSVIFRRNAQQISSESGLWDNALDIYPLFGATPKQTPRYTMVFPSGAKVSFSHLQYDTDVHSWQGSSIALICFDELTHFTRKQFFYMLSRNRSTCGVRPYIRATCNADADSWVADFIAWWIDQKTGYPIPERSGVIRYFIRSNDELIWGDSREELAARHGVDISDTKSFTFIASSIYDNKILLTKDPGYLANLKALSYVDRMRLLEGNWKVKPAAGLYFKRSQVTLIEALPTDVVAWVRRWDLAASAPTEQNPSPDSTAGVLMGRRKNGRYVVADVINVQQQAGDVRQLIKNTAISDKVAHKRVKTVLPQDPGQAGKEQSQSYVKMLSGFNVGVERETGSKIVRAEPFAAQWQNGNVEVLVAPWNDLYFSQMEAFPESAKDDLVDGSSGAFNALQDKGLVLVAFTC